MKKLRSKLRARSGLSMVEMLAAVVALVLLCLALNSGMNIAVHAYRSMTAEAETELLLSTAADALTNELRYATPRSFSATGELQRYDSATFGSGSQITFTDGQLVVKNSTSMDKGHPLLATGAYGKNGVYELSFTEPIKYDSASKTFTFTLCAEQEDLASAEQEFTVRCLNGDVT